MAKNDGYVGKSPQYPKIVETTYTFTATEGQSVFSPVLYHQTPKVRVNGVGLSISNGDFSANTGTSITLTSSVAALINAGDTIEVDCT